MLTVNTSRDRAKDEGRVNRSRIAGAMGSRREPEEAGVDHMTSSSGSHDQPNSDHSETSASNSMHVHVSSGESRELPLSPPPAHLPPSSPAPLPPHSLGTSLLASQQPDMQSSGTLREGSVEHTSGRGQRSSTPQSASSGRERGRPLSPLATTTYHASNSQEGVLNNPPPNPTTKWEWPASYSDLTHSNKH